ncbi:MAG: hypothetical protein EB161_01185 [Nitrosopumilaceae archaeon]|nr:hypothetical protein [Nitrosopumilaceae archaeon]
MLDKIITGLFVGVLGTLWFFTRRCEISHPYKIITYDYLGKQVSLDGIRIIFNTHSVAVSFAKHYKELFPQYDFVLESGLPQIKLKFLTV